MRPIATRTPKAPVAPVQVSSSLPSLARTRETVPSPRLATQISAPSDRTTQRKSSDSREAEDRLVLRRPELVQDRPAAQAQLQRAAAVVVAVDVDDQVDRDGVGLDGDRAAGAQRHDGRVGDVGRVGVVVQGRDQRDASAGGEDPQVARRRRRSMPRS